MRVALVQQSGNNGFTILDGYRDALVDEGHAVEQYSLVRKKRFILCRIWTKLTGMTPRIKLGGNIEKIKKFRAEVIIFSRIEGLSEVDLIKLKTECGVKKIVMIYTDHPAVLPGIKHYEKLSKMIATLDLLYVFTESIIPIFYQLGAKKVSLLKFALKKDFHIMPKDIPPEYISEIAYIGTYGKLIERQLYSIKKTGKNLKIYGQGWKGKQITKEPWVSYREQSGIGENMKYAARGAQIVVNFTRAEHSCTISMKTYELIACGANLITNYSDDQYKEIGDIDTCRFFNTTEEMLTLIEKNEKTKKPSSNLKKFTDENCYNARVKTMLSDLITE